MARRTWVQDPDTGKLIPKAEYRRGKDYQHYVQGDIEAFVSVIDGSVIMTVASCAATTPSTVSPTQKTTAPSSCGAVERVYIERRNVRARQIV